MVRPWGTAFFAATALAQSQYGENNVRVTFDSQIVEQTAFPAPNVALFSPAFRPNATFGPGWVDGTEGATSPMQLNAFLSSMADKNPSWAKYDITPFLSEQEETFPYVYLSTAGNITTGKLRVWIQGSVHGNEPAGDEATLALLGAMDQDPEWAAGFLERMDILVFGHGARQCRRCHKTVEDAVADLKQSNEDIVVTDYTAYASRTYTMVDRRNGEVVQLPVQFSSTTPATANLTRQRPEAYIIPRAWSDLAERLRVSGLEVETLDDGFKGEGEVYNITSSSLATSYYEGTILNPVTTETLVQDINLPRESFWVSSAQKNVGLAFVALEPENIDSYVSYGIIPMEIGDIYPVFRKV